MTYLAEESQVIQKIYEVDHLTCPQCRGVMRIISFIKDQKAIREILEHLGLWIVEARTNHARKSHGSPIEYYQEAAEYADYSPYPENEVSCVHAAAHADAFYGDPEYSWDDYLNI